MFPAAENKIVLTPVIERMPADLLTPLAVYLKLADEGQDSFLLESVEGGENLARFSFVGVNPKFTVSSSLTQCTIGSDDRQTVFQQNGFDFLREHFADVELERGTGLPLFSGGAIGYFGFESVQWFEPTIEFEAEERILAEFMFFDSVIAFDHVRQSIQIISLACEKQTSDDYRTLEEASAHKRRIRGLLEDGRINLHANGVSGPSSVRSNFEQAQFEIAVRKIKELIAAGECYQVVISQRFERETNATPIAIYRAIRSINPSPYMFLLQIGDKAVIGASPEMLVRCRDRKLEYRPIAGTRPRSNDFKEDDRLADEMRTDVKEVAEHMMLVDLGRNDLGRVSQFGSVKVDRLREVENYSHVQHLVSQLSASLDDGKDRFDALAACFPAGTVSGAPKVRAIEIISDLEPDQRGVYAGAVGYFDYAGNMDTCIAIRTLVLEHGVAKIQAGAGIVADSVPASEFDETVNKAKAMLRAIDIAEGNA